MIWFNEFWNLEIDLFFILIIFIQITFLKLFFDLVELGVKYRILISQRKSEEKSKPINLPLTLAPPLPPPPPNFFSPPPLPESPTRTKSKYIFTKKSCALITRLKWETMNVNEVSGTIFEQFSSFSVLNDLNLIDFEENFKIKARKGDTRHDRVVEQMEKLRARGPSIITASRARNIGILLRKINLDNESICKTISNFERKIPIEYVQIIPTIIPNQFERKKFEDFINNNNPFDKLTNEEQLMLKLSKIPRISTKLEIMILIENYSETYLSLQKQLDLIEQMAKCLVNSELLKETMEIILAIGNFMNSESTKYHTAHGFRISSLETVARTKSSDKTQTLVDFIWDQALKIFKPPSHIITLKIP